MIDQNFKTWNMKFVKDGVTNYIAKFEICIFTIDFVNRLNFLGHF